VLLLIFRDHGFSCVIDTQRLEASRLGPALVDICQPEWECLQEHKKINVGDDKRHKWVCVLISETLRELVVFNRIKRVANVIVGRNVHDLEQGAGVVAPGRGFHVLLKIQERRELSEEHRKGRRGDVGHGGLGIVAGAPIRECGGDGASASDEMIESARVHAPSNAGTASKVQVTIGCPT